MTELDLGIAGEYYCCYDLAINGFKAFPSEQGLPFDLVLVKDNQLYRVQVKTTTSLTKGGFYSHGLKNGKKGSRKIYTNDEVDVIAFVNLTDRVVAYFWLKDYTVTMNFYPEGRLSKRYKLKYYKDFPIDKLF